MDEASEIIVGVLSDNQSSQLKSTANFLKILSSDVTSPTVDKVIQFGLVPCFVEFLMKKHDPMPQNEAASVITKLASKNAKMIIDDGAVPILIRLASDILGYNDLREKATLALGNIACDSLQSRDYVLKCGALMPVLAQLNEQANISILRTATWTLSNLCRGQPPRLFDQVKLVLAEIVEKVLHKEDKDILANACWSFYYLSYGSKDGIKSLIDADLVPRLVRFLQHTSSDVFVPALNTIGNIVSGDHEKTQCVINSGALRILANMLNGDYEKRVEKDACWTVSNITAGTEEQIQLVIDANMIPTLVNLAQNARFDIKKEALFAISNATSGGSHDQIKYLVEKNCIKPLCDFLVSPDPRIISCVIDSGGLPILANMLTQEYEKRIKLHNCEKIIKKTCWIITNITAGTSKQIQSVIDANLIPNLVSLAQDTELDIKIKALWAISKAASGGSDAQIKYLVEKNCIKPICDVLVCPDLKIISVCLDGLGSILKVGEAEKKKTGGVIYYRQLIEDAEGLEKIKNLQSHDDIEIKEKALKILETYWP